MPFKSMWIFDFKNIITIDLHQLQIISIHIFDYIIYQEEYVRKYVHTVLHNQTTCPDNIVSAFFY